MAKKGTFQHTTSRLLLYEIRHQSAHKAKLVMFAVASVSVVLQPTHCVPLTYRSATALHCGATSNLNLNFNLTLQHHPSPIQSPHSHPQTAKMLVKESHVDVQTTANGKESTMRTPTRQILPNQNPLIVILTHTIYDFTQASFSSIPQSPATQTRK